ncbi:MAG: TonB-dependent receptor [Bacteroidota bacterium]
MKIFLFLILFSSQIFSQSKGVIEGKVIDEKTGEAIPGANVKIKGTYYGAASNFNGEYKILNINSGEYTLEASLIGYTTVLHTGVKVLPNQNLTINIKLKETIVSIGEEVIIIGEKPLFDIEQASSARTISSDEIQSAPIMGVQAVASKQVGVMQTAEGIYIRGARSYETSYFVDGVSAKDPLAGTGFGVDVSNRSMKEIEITTGGIGAEYGSTAGVISVTTQSGGDDFDFYFQHKRDNLFLNKNSESNFNTDAIETNFSGPILNEKLFFFTSFSGFWSDEFTRNPASQLNSSIFGGTNYTPRQDNRFTSLVKLTFKPSSSEKIEASYRRSVKINQNTRMLQIGGNDIVLGPGFQYPFMLEPDNANTYTHDAILTSLKLTKTLNAQTFFELQLSRLFTRLRADANGRMYRPDSITSELDARSIFTYPISYWQFSNFDSLIYVIQGDPFLAGLFNNGGIAPLWHDHFAEEYTIKFDFNYNYTEHHKFRAGVETKIQEYQWVDINRPWIGAPIQIGDPSRSLGESFDIWHVFPSQTAIYFQDQISYKGLIAYLGLRYQFWFPGKFVDDLFENPLAYERQMITKEMKENYFAKTFSLGSIRFKARALPRVRVSFPVSDNQVLFFNYGHAVDWPNAYQVYSGLDVNRPDRSPLSRVGNPSLEPETTVEYEIGIRNQLTTDDVFTFSAYSKDKFDYVVRRYLPILDKTTYVNEDYARVNGIELSYIKRIGTTFRGSLMGSYQVAKGKSNSAEASFFRFSDEETTKEKFLAWDRPLLFRATGTFNFNDDDAPFEIFKKSIFYAQFNFQSGKRYTPYEITGFDYNTRRAIYREDLSQEYQKIGKNWWWVDANIQKKFSYEKLNFTLALEITNLFNTKNSTIINPLTGRAYEYGDPTPFRDPTQPHPEDKGLPPFDPARYLEQRHFMLALSFNL